MDTKDIGVSSGVTKENSSHSYIGVGKNWVLRLAYYHMSEIVLFELRDLKGKNRLDTPKILVVCIISLQCRQTALSEGIFNHSNLHPNTIILPSQ